MIPSAQLLKANKVNFQLLKYPEKIRDTTLVAKHVSVNANQLFKSLVVLNQSSPMVIMIPSNSKLDINLLRSIFNKKLKMVSVPQAEKLTGLKVGGISPLALTQKNIPVFIEQSIKKFDWIAISAGKRGVAIKLPVSDFIRLTNAKFIKLA